MKQNTRCFNRFVWYIISTCRKHAAHHLIQFPQWKIRSMKTRQINHWSKGINWHLHAIGISGQSEIKYDLRFDSQVANALNCGCKAVRKTQKSAESMLRLLQCIVRSSWLIGFPMAPTANDCLNGSLMIKSSLGMWHRSLIILIQVLVTPHSTLSCMALYCSTVSKSQSPWLHPVFDLALQRYSVRLSVLKDHWHNQATAQKTMNICTVWPWVQIGVRLSEQGHMEVSN